jgi:hypothetical protein
MIDQDPILRMQAQLSAQEYVMKIMINVLGQIAPNSGMQAAMHLMLKNSVSAASINMDDPSQTEEMRAYVLKYGQQIIDAAFGARPASRLNEV